MAISAYVGVPGSGKSYEVVKSVLLPAYLSGRRIVTNIEGINEDNFKSYALSKTKALEHDLGSIIHVSDGDVIKDNFFPFKTSDLSIQTICKAGDLIAIDELWRIWGSDTKIPDNHRSFIAEHRHFTDEKTGLCCDLIVINQSVANLPRFLKDRIETTYKMSKHVALGLKSRYRVDVYNGIKITKNNKVTSYQEKYQTAIFSLYKSYDGHNGKESTTDKRQNILSNKRIWFFVIFLLVMLIISISFIYRFFNNKTNDLNTEQSTTTSSLQKQKETKQNAYDVQPITSPKLSNIWRIAGELKQNGKAFVVLINNNGHLRLEPASLFNFSGTMLSGVLNGELITRYSGNGGQVQ